MNNAIRDSSETAGKLSSLEQPKAKDIQQNLTSQYVIF
jgi:hypothetical protein